MGKVGNLPATPPREGEPAGTSVTITTTPPTTATALKTAAPGSGACIVWESCANVV